MKAESRTTYAEVDPRLMPLLDRRDEGLRLAYFAYSQTVVAGSKPSFRYPNQTNSEKQQ
jgi:hypothetical protein